MWVTINLFYILITRLEYIVFVFMGHPCGRPVNYNACASIEISHVSKSFTLRQALFH